MGGSRGESWGIVRSVRGFGGVVEGCQSGDGGGLDAGRWARSCLLRVLVFTDDALPVFLVAFSPKEYAPKILKDATKPGEYSGISARRERSNCGQVCKVKFNCSERQ